MVACHHGGMTREELDASAAVSGEAMVDAWLRQKGSSAERGS